MEKLFQWLPSEPPRRAKADPRVTQQPEVLSKQSPVAPSTDPFEFQREFISYNLFRVSVAFLIALQTHYMHMHACACTHTHDAHTWTHLPSSSVEKPGLI